MVTVVSPRGFVAATALALIGCGAEPHPLPASAPMTSSRPAPTTVVAPTPSASEAALDGEPAPPQALEAQVDLVTTPCRAGRGHVTLHSSIRVLQGCCDGRCFAQLVDADGALGAALPYGLGAPDLVADDEVHAFEGRWPDAAWLAARRRRDGAPVRVAVHEHQAGRWSLRYETREPEGFEAVLGLGSWPGGARIAALRSEIPGEGTQRVEIVAGRATEALPALPDLREDWIVAFTSFASGHAFAVGRSDRGLVLSRWVPGQPEPIQEHRPDLFSAQFEGTLVTVPTMTAPSPDAVHVVASDRGRRTTLAVLRFDGTRWAVTARLPGAEVSALETSDDGATWLLTGGWLGALWRRSPGPDGTWARVAGDAIGDGTALDGQGLVPVPGGALLLARLEDGSQHLYRVRLAGAAP